MNISPTRRIIATSATDITRIGIEVAREQFDEMVKDTERVMKEKAPKKRNSVNAAGKKGGKGSMVTGKTKKSIRILRLGEYHVLVGPTTEYAYYAENGRDPITSSDYMIFRGADGRWHRARHVSGMEGWHFVKETADYIRTKYGV